MEETNKKLSKYELELMWFGVGVTLAVMMPYSLEYCIDELIRRKSGYCQLNGRSTMSNDETSDYKRSKES